MSTPITTPLIIDLVEGGAGSELYDCYFLYDRNNQYNFFSKHGHSKGTSLEKGSLLMFQLDGQPYWWAMYIDHVSDKEVKGKWASTKPSFAQDEGGTFTAQAGGNEDAETASSANA